MKRFGILLSLILILSLSVIPSVSANSYNVYYPSSILYIDKSPIASVQIGNDVCVDLQQLTNYHFDLKILRETSSHVEFSLHINDSKWFSTSDYNSYKPCMAGNVLGSAYKVSATYNNSKYTDLYVYSNTYYIPIKVVESFNISISSSAGTTQRSVHPDCRVYRILCDYVTKYSQNNQFREALDLLNSVLDGSSTSMHIDPGSHHFSDVKTMRTDIAFSLYTGSFNELISAGDYDEAIKSLSWYFAYDTPDSDNYQEALNLLSNAVYAKYYPAIQKAVSDKNYEEAFTLINKIHPDSKLTYTISENSVYYNEINSLREELAYIIIMNEVNTLLAENNYDSALGAIADFLQHYASSGSAYSTEMTTIADNIIHTQTTVKVNTHIASGEYDKALELLNKVISENRNSSYFDNYMALREEMAYIIYTQSADTFLNQGKFTDAQAALNTFFRYSTSPDSPYFLAASAKAGELEMLPYQSVSSQVNNYVSAGDYDSAINLLSGVLGHRNENGVIEGTTISPDSYAYSQLASLREELAYIRFTGSADILAGTGDFSGATEMVKLFFPYSTSEESPYYMSANAKIHEYFYLDIRKTVDSYIAAGDYDSALSALNWALGSYDVEGHCGEPYGVPYGDNHIYNNNMDIASPYFPILITLREEVAFVVAKNNADIYIKAEKYGSARSAYNTYIYSYCIPSTSEYYVAANKNLSDIDAFEYKTVIKNTNTHLANKDYFSAYITITQYYPTSEYYQTKKNEKLVEVCNSWKKSCGSPLAMAAYSINSSNELAINFVNLTGKPIIAFKYSFVPKDIFGDTLYYYYTSTIEPYADDIYLPAYWSSTWYWDMDRYDGRLKSLYNFKITKVVFADGTSWQL